MVRLCGGAYHAGAVLSDGSAYVWGANTHSQLGLGDQLNRKHPTKLRYMASQHVDTLALGVVVALWKMVPN